MTCKVYKERIGVHRERGIFIFSLGVLLSLGGLWAAEDNPDPTVKSNPSQFEDSIAWIPQVPLEETVTIVDSTACGLITLRHIEAGGIGYEHGYSSLTGLAFPNTTPGRWVWPVVDVRVHEFNDNTQAGNLGIGARFASSKLSRVFGANLYYDYRNTHHGSYNQIGAGFEFLGERIDLRINGYLPLGEKKHTITHCKFRYPGGFLMERKKIETAIGGGNLEVGAYITKVRHFSFYAAAGPYYLTGDVCRHVFGGEFRFDISYKKYGFIEGRVSHDNVFETKVQGMIGVSIPLGCKPAKNGLTKRQFPEEIMSIPIERHEIIPLEKNCRWKTNF
ncbi:MAG: inverse autotransporter beta domain-containing protein [Verrucomicrobia bacterium]|nr:inverse autotransporter beta domain-containing protein [Verrucomicrobiota bacterium]